MKNPARASLGKWGALGVLMALAFLNYLDRHLIYPLLDPISRDLGLSPEQLGALATGFFVVYAISAPLTGYASDRLSRKAILASSVLAWSLVTALSGTAGGFGSLLLWRSLTGLGEGGYFPTAVSLIGDLFGPKQRGKAIAFHGVCTTLGGSAGYALGGMLGARMGWRLPFFFAIVPGLVLSAVLIGWFRDPRQSPDAEEPKVDRSRVEATPGLPLASPSYLSIVGSPPVLLIALSACAGAFAMTGINTFLPLYLKEARGVSLSDAGLFTGLLYAATLAGQLLGGLASDHLAIRFAGARPLLVALPYLLVAPAAVAIPHVGFLPVALAAYGATQMARGWAEPNIYGTIIDGTSPQTRGTAQGFLLLLTFAGASASPWLVGRVIRLFGYPAALEVIGATALLAALFAFALLAHLKLKNPAEAKGATGAV